MSKSSFRGLAATTAMGIQLVAIIAFFQIWRHYPSGLVPVSVVFLSAFLMFKLYKTRNFIEAIPTSKVRSVAIGMAEVTGKVKKWKRTFKAPFSGELCLAYNAKEERRQRINKNYVWVTTWHKREDGHFFIEDDTGQLLCESKGADLDVKRFQKFFGSVKRTEWKIVPGTKYFAIGKVIDNPFVKDATSVKGFKDAMMSKGEIYIISDKKEKSLRKWYTAALAFSTVATLAFTAGSFYLLAGI